MRSAVLIAILLASAPAFADRDLCAPDAKHRGKLIDLDLEHAELGHALRFIADVAKINLVVSDNVVGSVSLHLRQVSWDQAACAIAATHDLSLRLDDTILIVRLAPKR
jgi:type IV pilus assembly protein PilQ